MRNFLRLRTSRLPNIANDRAFVTVINPSDVVAVSLDDPRNLTEEVSENNTFLVLVKPGDRCRCVCHRQPVLLSWGMPQKTPWTEVWNG